MSQCITQLFLKPGKQKLNPASLFVTSGVISILWSLGILNFLIRKMGILIVTLEDHDGG